MKRLLRLLLVPVALLLVALFGALFFVDSLTRRAVEEGGTRALGVETTLTGASIGLFSGEFALEGLAVANPPGFEKPEFFRLDQGALELPLSELLGDEITIPSLRLEGITLDLERNSKGTNYGQILANLERTTGGAGGGSGGGGEEPAADGGGKAFVLQELVIRRVRAEVNLLPAGGELTRLSIDVPDIRVEGLSNTMTLTQICALVVRTVVRAAVEAGGDVLPADLRNDLRGRLDAVEDRARARLDEKLDEATQRLDEEAKKLGPEAEKALEGAKEKVNEKLKGLLDRGE